MIGRSRIFSQLFLNYFIFFRISELIIREKDTGSPVLEISLAWIK